MTPTQHARAAIYAADLAVAARAYAATQEEDEMTYYPICPECDSDIERLPAGDYRCTYCPATFAADDPRVQPQPLISHYEANRAAFIRHEEDPHIQTYDLFAMVDALRGELALAQEQIAELRALAHGHMDPYPGEGMTLD